MLVRFKSAHFDGSTFWTVGVHDFPAEINGKKVVFFDGKATNDEKVYLLPRSAVPADSAVPAVAPERDKPMALSEVGKSPAVGFVDAMKSK